ncbi:MAG: hypothetical protein V5B78_01515 [Desulfohalobiaceae bacterium]
MTQTFSSTRQIKAHLRRILADEDWVENFTRLISEIPPQRTISPLFAALFSKLRIMRWHAVSCFGIAASELAAENTEQVRIVLRRCTWSLNDESGGIGWGAPEAMAEILASVPRIAEEYASILVSFVLEREEACNYLEHSPLREGAYWGIARLAQARPELIAPWQEYLLQAIDCETSPFILGTSALIITSPGFNTSWTRQTLKKIESQEESIILYWNRAFWNVAVGDLARNGSPSESSYLADSKVA